MSEKKAPYKRVKTSERNLIKKGDSYYYLRGSTEKSLGTFPSEKAAIEYKRIFEAKRDSIGALAFKFRAKDVWPDYEKDRMQEMESHHLGRHNISKKTVIEFQSIWRLHLRPFFGNKRLAEIDTVLWNQYVKRAPVADLTNHRKVLGTFIRWCNAQGYMKSIPLMEVPSVKRRVRPIMKPDQIEKLLEHSQGPLLTFVALYLFMGVRWGEIIQLRWESIDIERGFMQIREETSKTRNARAVPINAFTLTLLRSARDTLQASQIETPWVFPKAGRPREHRFYTSIYLSWSRMLKRAGLSGITPHDLRATYEYFANKRADFTDTQREKMAGAAIEVQRKHYVSFEAEDVRGLEEVVVFPGLEKVIATKLSARDMVSKGSGKTQVSKNLTDRKKRALQKEKSE